MKLMRTKLFYNTIILTTLLMSQLNIYGLKIPIKKFTKEEQTTLREKALQAQISKTAKKRFEASEEISLNFAIVINNGFESEKLGALQKTILQSLSNTETPVMIISQDLLIQIIEVAKKKDVPPGVWADKLKDIIEKLKEVFWIYQTNKPETAGVSSDLYILIAKNYAKTILDENDYSSFAKDIKDAKKFMSKLGLNEENLYATSVDKIPSTKNIDDPNFDVNTVNKIISSIIKIPQNDPRLRLFYYSGHGLPGSNGDIAGIKQNEARRLIKQLSKCADFLYISSCFAGGLHAENIKNDLVNLGTGHGQMIMMIQGFGDKTATLISGFQMLNTFFKKMRQLLSTGEGKIAEIVSYVSGSTPEGIKTVPADAPKSIMSQQAVFIYLPGSANGIELQDIDKKLTVIGNVQGRRYYKDQSLKDIKINDQFYVAVIPNKIDATIIIDGNIPRIESKKGGSPFITFEKIKISKDATLSDAMAAMFGVERSQAYSKKFLIKSLEINKKDYKNVFVKVKVSDDLKTSELKYYYQNSKETDHSITPDIEQEIAQFEKLCTEQLIEHPESGYTRDYTKVIQEQIEKLVSLKIQALDSLKESLDKKLSDQFNLIKDYFTCKFRTQYYVDKFKLDPKEYRDSIDDDSFDNRINKSTLKKHKQSLEEGKYTPKVSAGLIEFGLGKLKTSYDQKKEVVSGKEFQGLDYKYNIIRAECRKQELAMYANISSDELALLERKIENPNDPTITTLEQIEKLVSLKIQVLDSLKESLDKKLSDQFNLIKDYFTCKFRTQYYVDKFKLDPKEYKDSIDEDSYKNGINNPTLKQFKQPLAEGKYTPKNVADHIEDKLESFKTSYDQKKEVAGKELQGLYYKYNVIRAECRKQELAMCANISSDELALLERKIENPNDPTIKTLEQIEKLVSLKIQVLDSLKESLDKKLSDQFNLIKDYFTCKFSAQYYVDKFQLDPAKYKDSIEKDSIENHIDNSMLERIKKKLEGGAITCKAIADFMEATLEKLKTSYDQKKEGLSDKELQSLDYKYYIIRAECKKQELDMYADISAKDLAQLESKIQEKAEEEKKKAEEEKKAEELKKAEEEPKAEAVKKKAAEEEEEEEAKAKKKEEEKTRIKAEEDAKKKSEEDAKIKAEEAKIKAKKEAEEDVAKKKAEEEAKKEEEKTKAKEAEEKAKKEAKIKAKEEARIKAQEAETKRKAEEEAKKKAEEARKAQEAEAKRKAEELKKAKEAEDKAKKEAQEKVKKEAEEAKIKAEEEAKKEEEKTKAEEAEAKRKAEEKAKKEAKIKVEEAKIKAEEEAKKEEEKTKAEEAEAKRKAEEEARKAKEAEEAETKRKAEEEKVKKEAEEAEAKRKAEEEEKKKSEEKAAKKKAEEEVLTDEKIDEIFGGLKSWSGLSAPKGDWVSYIESLDDDQRARLFVDRLTKASKSEAEPIKEKINSGAVFIKDPKFKQVSFRIKTLIDQSEKELAQAEKAQKVKEKLRVEEARKAKEAEEAETKRKAEEEKVKKEAEEAEAKRKAEEEKVKKEAEEAEAKRKAEEAEKKKVQPTPVTITEEETPPPLPPRDEPKTKSLKASLSNLRKSLQELKTKIELLQGKLVLLKENLS